MGSSDGPLPRVPARCRGARRPTAVVVGLLVAAFCAATVWAAPPASASPSSVSASAEPGRAPRGGWSWPLQPVPAVARRFEAPPQPWASGHRGVDLSATPGASVLAPADGVVAFAGSVAGRGVLSIDHAGGLRTTYEPVKAAAEAGEPVVRGQPVATLTAATGAQPGHCEAATCLHWGARRGTVYVDPLTLVRPADPPVLLPLAGWPGLATAVAGARLGSGRLARPLVPL